MTNVSDIAMAFRDQGNPSAGTEHAGGPARPHPAFDSDRLTRYEEARLDKRACFNYPIWKSLPQQTRIFQVRMGEAFAKHGQRIPFEFLCPKGASATCQPAGYHGRISPAQTHYMTASKDAFWFMYAARKCREHELPKIRALLDALKQVKGTLSPEQRQLYSEAKRAYRELDVRLDADSICPGIAFPDDEDNRTDEAPDPA